MSGKKRCLPGKTNPKSSRQPKKHNWYDLADTGQPPSQVRQIPLSPGDPPRRFHPDLPPRVEPSRTNESIPNANFETRSSAGQRPRSRASVVQKSDPRIKGYLPYPVSRPKRQKFPYFLLILGAAIAFILFVLHTILHSPAPQAFAGGGLSQPPGFAPASTEMPTVEALSIQYDYYPIMGGSAEELRKQMLQRGPQDAVTGTRFDGYTRWHLNWNFDTQSMNGQCQIQNVRVNAKATVTMPRWDIPADVPPMLVQQWKRYSDALRTHELGHVDHARQGRQEILQSFSLLPPAPSCPQAQAIADSLGGQIIQKYAGKDVEYDRVTGHGATQGAVFP